MNLGATFPILHQDAVSPSPPPPRFLRHDALTIPFHNKQETRNMNDSKTQLPTSERCLLTAFSVCFLPTFLKLVRNCLALHDSTAFRASLSNEAFRTEVGVIVCRVHSSSSENPLHCLSTNAKRSATRQIPLKSCFLQPYEGSNEQLYETVLLERTTLAMPLSWPWPHQVTKFFQDIVFAM